MNDSLIWSLIVGAVAGWLAGQFWKGSGFGLLGDIVIGILGGVVGVWLAGQFGIMGSSLLARIVISAVGAWVLLFLISLIKRA
ncbi:MAG: GlsB/YeaQ/YmgE family stress response membrane protein [Saprospiraceae bacterium]